MTQPELCKLPADFHEAIQPEWSQDDQVAKLLGQTAIEPPVTAYVGIRSLPKSLHRGIGFYEFSQDTEKRAAGQALVSDLVAINKPSTLVEHETLIKSLIVEHIVGNRLFCTDDVLQTVIDGFVDNTPATQHFSQLLSAWASFQRGALGERQMVIAWPSAIKDKRMYLGRMMHDVDLKIVGRMKAEIAQDSSNCRLELDRFEGRVGNGARGLTLTGKSLKGSVLRGAEDSSLVCSRLRLTEKTILGSGCMIKAEDVQGIISGMPADKYEDYVPPFIEITRLTGNVLAQPSWHVEIGKTISPSKNIQVRLMQSDPELKPDDEEPETEINSILERTIAVGVIAHNVSLRGVSQILTGIKTE